MEKQFKIISVISLFLSFLLPPIGFGLGLYAFLKIKKLEASDNDKVWKIVSLTATILGALFSLILLLTVIGSLMYMNVVDPQLLMQPQ